MKFWNSIRVSAPRSRRVPAVARGIPIIIILALVLAALPAPHLVLADTPPRMDGKIDEDAYAGSEVYFVGFVPGAAATQYTYTVPDGSIYVAWQVTLDYVDNSYGDYDHETWGTKDNPICGNKGHDLRALLKSDMQELQLYNSCGERVFWAEMDLADGYRGMQNCGGGQPLKVIGGRLDMNLSNGFDEADRSDDDGNWFGIPIVNGYVESNTYNADAGETIFGYEIIGGLLVTPSDPIVYYTGDFYGIPLIPENGDLYKIDMNHDGDADGDDNGWLSEISVQGGLVQGVADGLEFPPNRGFKVKSLGAIDGFIEDTKNGLFLYPAGCGDAASTPSGYWASMDASDSVKHEIDTYLYTGDPWDTARFEYTTSLVGNLNMEGYCTVPPVYDDNGEGDCYVESLTPPGGEPPPPVDLLGNQTEGTKGGDSPPWDDEPTYDPIDEYSQWEYHLTWELKFDPDVFVTEFCGTGGFGPSFTTPVYLHASPHKICGPYPPIYPAGWVGDYVSCYLTEGPVGINGVTLELSVQNATGGWDYVDQATTAYNVDDALDGYYLFERLPVGIDSEKKQYKVEVLTDLPSWPGGVGTTDQNQGGDNAAETTAGDHSDPDASGGLYYWAPDEVLLEDLSLDFEYICEPTGVVLNSFEAAPQGQAIEVTWETGSELKLLGFNLQRAESAAGEWTKLNQELIPSKVSGQPVGAVYDYMDQPVSVGVTYHYWLELLDTGGGLRTHGPVTATISMEPAFKFYLPVVLKALVP